MGTRILWAYCLFSMVEKRLIIDLGFFLSVLMIPRMCLIAGFPAIWILVRFMLFFFSLVLSAVRSLCTFHGGVVALRDFASVVLC